MTAYRSHFRPGALPNPLAILAVAVVCADTDAEAERLAATVDLNFVRRARGEFLPLASPEEAASYDYTAADRERIRNGRERLIVGSPDTVEARLAPLISATRADELMITTMIYDHAARRHSYELVAKKFGLKPAESEA
jgi:alkanesulfonate monooxygenase SsuD/methylene tetrahydromethanopterin reductase-like flavin-dependent oxidoreductase (luciferase family)